MPFVRVYPGLELHYEEVGEGPPLLCMDGVGASWVWYRNVPALSKHFRLILLDVMGTGLSAKPLGPYPIEVLARQAADVIEALDLGRTHLMGLSEGGLAAMEVALRWPGLADRLVVVGATPGGAVAVPPSAPYWLEHSPLPGWPEGLNFLRTISGALSPRFMACHPEEVFRIGLMAAAAPTPVTSRLSINTGALLWQGLGARAAELVNPVLALAGSDDFLALAVNTVRLASVLPNSRCYLFPGSGHLCQVEQPRMFNRLVTQFLLAESC